MYFADNKSLVRKSFVLLENHLRLLCLRLSVKHKLFIAQVFNIFFKASSYIIAKDSSQIGATLKCYCDQIFTG